MLLLVRRRSLAASIVVLALGLSLHLAGCDSTPAGQVEVLASIGKTGRGPCEFIYPRAIDLAADGTLWVVDKTGRLQHIGPDGSFISVIRMPEIEAGKPTGLSIGPDGNVWVADTHYHRVMVFSPAGELVRQFGRFGQGPGCFIYPTDVAFADDGRVFVSEYGGNDRVSVFSPQGKFLHSFGSPGSGRGQFSRPAALAVDQKRRRLYVADAVNHRIAIYDLRGGLLGYIGAAGKGPGELRYPYDLALTADGSLVVCEYGNNRLQVFAPDGASRGTYGGPGRQLGQLAYPWGVAVDDKGTAYVVDAGNNRLQVWRL
ncbi:MAG: hypothetical protein AMJ81_11420 [Phycisphaerae bacterium SM23_33]|nr:MAG: hypothetical protein AMJ81_11420 [Phycisphaerae bacterium SM23_33]